MAGAKKRDGIRPRKEREKENRSRSGRAGKRGGEKERERVETGHGEFTKARMRDTQRGREKCERCEKEGKGVCHGGNCGQQSEKERTEKVKRRAEEAKERKTERRREGGRPASSLLERSNADQLQPGAAKSNPGSNSARPWPRKETRRTKGGAGRGGRGRGDERWRRRG